ncbi:MAG: hypothetical protein KUG54_01025, partial [Gammaproteobacteria bacterium]|nr:hypothetical protein [Gammaproteobacteria bacterium]
AADADAAITTQHNSVAANRPNLLWPGSQGVIRAVEALFVFFEPTGLLPPLNCPKHPIKPAIKTNLSTRTF